MKIAITGKGGVGKSTLSGLLSLVFAEEGKSVLAVDADPDANLASILGFSMEEIQNITPLSKMKDLISERTGVKGPSFGQMFKLNPKVDDIPDRYSLKKDGIRLLVLGTVETGGSGCFCPESALLKSLTHHLIVRRNEVVIMDMEAGIEHLGRGTASFVEAFIVVVEPSNNSLQTAHKIKDLAKDIGVKKVYLVANKIKNKEDLDFIKNNAAGLDILGEISFSTNLLEGDIKGLSPYVSSPKTTEEVRKIKDELNKVIESKI